MSADVASSAAAWRASRRLGDVRAASVAVLEARDRVGGRVLNAADRRRARSASSAASTSARPRTASWRWPTRSASARSRPTTSGRTSWSWTGGAAYPAATGISGDPASSDALGDDAASSTRWPRRSASRRRGGAAGGRVGRQTLGPGPRGERRERGGRTIFDAPARGDLGRRARTCRCCSRCCTSPRAGNETTPGRPRAADHDGRRRAGVALRRRLAARRDAAWRASSAPGVLDAPGAPHRAAPAGRRDRDADGLDGRRAPGGRRRPARARRGDRLRAGAAAASASCSSGCRPAP